MQLHLVKWRLGDLANLQELLSSVEYNYVMCCFPNSCLDNGHYFYGLLPELDGSECLNNNTSEQGKSELGFLMKLQKSIMDWW